MFEGPLRQPGQPLAVPCVVIHYSRERYGHREALGKLLLHSPGNDPVMQPSNKPKADHPKQSSFMPGGTRGRSPTGLPLHPGSRTGQSKSSAPPTKQPAPFRVKPRCARDPATFV